jgi:hypothetical protein
MHIDHTENTNRAIEKRSADDLLVLARDGVPLETLFRMPDGEWLIDRLTFTRGRLV